jgi:hypothetical protein
MKQAVLCLSLFLAAVSVSGDKKFGEPCGIPNPCAEEQYCPQLYGPFRGDCVPGLYCDDVCKYDVNHSCEKNSDCIDDLCHNGKCSKSGAPGTPCVTLNDCMPHLICGNDKTCQPRTFVPIGGPCTQSTQCEFYCYQGKCSKLGTYECNNDSGCKKKGLKCVGGSCM